jgi:hypothetical protein
VAKLLSFSFKPGFNLIVGVNSVGKTGDGARHLTPFDPVAVWWLVQRLARSAT